MLTAAAILGDRGGKETVNGSKEEVEKEKGSASDGVDMSNVKGNPLQFLEEEMSQAEEQFTDAPPLPAT